MKKVLSIALVLAMSFVFIGCGSDSSSGLALPDFDGTTTTAVINTAGKANIVANEGINARITTYNAFSLAFGMLDYIGGEGYVEGIDNTVGILEGCGGTGSVAISNLVRYAGDKGGTLTATFTDFTAYDPADELGGGTCLTNEVIASGSMDFTMKESWSEVDNCLDFGETGSTGTETCEIGSASGKITLRNLLIVDMDLGDYGPYEGIIFDGAATFSETSTRVKESWTETLSIKFTDDTNPNPLTNETMLGNLKTTGSWTRTDGVETENITGDIYIADIGKVRVSTPDSLIDGEGDLVLAGDVDITVDMDTMGWSAIIDGGGEAGTVAPHNEY